MKRSFLDYIDDYSYESFDEVARAFLTWQEVHGYIDTMFSNNIYIWNNHKLQAYVHGRNLSLEESKEWSEKQARLVNEINTFGYQTDYFLDSFPIAEDKQRIEEDFVLTFLEVLFPDIKSERKLQKVENFEFVYKSFERVIAGMHLENKDPNIDHIELLSQFLAYYQKLLEPQNFGIFLIEDITHYWKDLGVIIYDKKWLSQSILFYQIGDDN